MQRFCSALLVAVIALAPTGAVRAQALPGGVDPHFAVRATLKGMDSALEVKRLAEAFSRNKDHVRQALATDRLVELVPESAAARLENAAAYALANEKSAAYERLLKLQQMGAAYAVESDARFGNLHGTELWDHIVGLMKNNRAPWGEGRTWTDLGAEHKLVEALGWDPVRKAVLVGDAVSGNVSIVDQSGRSKPLIAGDAENGPWSILSMAVDGKRDRLWVGSTALPHFAGYSKSNAGRSALFEFALASGKLVKRHELPEGVTGAVLSSVAVSGSGKVVVADGPSNRVFHLDQGALSAFFRIPDGGSLRGMAISDDGRLLYVADYINGILVVDMSSRKAGLLQNPDNLLLADIDGIAYYQGHLVISQNNLEPKRVMRLRLSEDGESVVHVQPLDAAWPQLSWPTSGTMADGKFIFVANSQKGRFDGNGLVKSGQILEPIKLFASDVRFAWDAYDKQQEQARKRAAIKPSEKPTAKPKSE